MIGIKLNKNKVVCLFSFFSLTQGHWINYSDDWHFWQYFVGNV